VEFGTKHTNIVNNLCFATYYRAIEVFLASMSGAADANSFIAIQNNTCDYYHDEGIVVHGVADLDDAGVVLLANNIVSGSYQYGLALVDNYMYATVTNTGYFDNANNKNWAFDEDNPVFETVLPYETGTRTLPVCYLRQDCNFINTGSFFIEQTELISKTTDVNSFPDSNVIDIGFHYPNWNFSNAGSGDSLTADFDDNMKVDFNDFAVLANYWMQPTSTEVDLDDSGFVDMNDLFIFSSQWLDTFSLGFGLSQEPNSVSGELGILLTGYSEELSYYLLLNGEYKGLFISDSEGIQTEKYRNGRHEVKVVALSNTGEIWAGLPVEFFANNPVYCYAGNDSFKYNSDYHFSGLYNPTGETLLQLRLENVWGDIVWSDSTTGNVTFNIPNSFLSTPYNELIMEESLTAGGSPSMNSDWPGYIKEIVKEFDVTSDPDAKNAKSLLVLRKGGFLRNWPKNRKGVWREFLHACERRNMEPTIILYQEQATRANIQTAFQIQSVEAIYIISDGNRRVGDPDEDPNCPWRTYFQAYDGPFFSYLGRNWTGNPEDYVNLGHYESGYSVADSINFFNAKSHLHVFHDCCKNGPMCMDDSFYTGTMLVPSPSDNDYNVNDYNRTRDMAKAYGIYPDSEDRNYMSWRGFAFKGNPLLHYNTFLEALWTQLGDWDTYIVAFGEAANADLGCYIPAQNFSHVGDLSDRFIP
jgi:hypothetical protein